MSNRYQTSTATAVVHSARNRSIFSPFPAQLPAVYNSCEYKKGIPARLNFWPTNNTFPRVRAHTNRITMEPRECIFIHRYTERVRGCLAARLFSMRMQCNFSTNSIACPKSERNGDRGRQRDACDAHARKIIGPLLYIGYTYCTIHAHTHLVTVRLAYMKSTMASGGGTFASAKCSSDRTHARTR